MSNKTALSRCLRTLHKEPIEPEENDNYQPFTIEHFQQNPSEVIIFFFFKDHVTIFFI